MARELKSAFSYTHNGKELLIRWVRPEDRDRLEAGVKMMSDQGLYLRFFMPIKQLSDQQLEFFTQVDQVNHVAWGILDAENTTIPGLGIARYVRDKNEPHIAEAAVTIPDSYQNQGFGTLLLAVLHLSAAHKQITTLRSIVLTENDGLIRLLKSLGGEVRVGQDLNTVVVDQPVYVDAAQIPDISKNQRFRHLLQSLKLVIYTDI